MKPSSVETELAILNVISEHCDKALRMFDSSVEEDEKEIENIEPYTNRWNILNMIIGEKKVLLFYKNVSSFVHKNWNESKSVHKVGRLLRKHNELYPYYKVYWSHLT